MDTFMDLLVNALTRLSFADYAFWIFIVGYLTFCVWEMDNGKQKNKA